MPLTEHTPSTPDPRFLLDPFEPAYLAPHRTGELANRAAAGLRELENCCACPRNCRINRLANETRVCNTGRYARVASVFPHFGEEDCLRGWRGSGTIFFSLCNLRCVFCQNWDISQKAVGQEYTDGQLAALMLELQDLGCHNINFVTPEHVAPQVIEAIAAAVPRGLRLLIVYNTSAYDSLSSLKLLDGLIDIYMPDFKFWERETARRLCKAKDYPDRAREAILEMHRQVGPLKFGPDGLARRGVLVRHLVMPGQLDEAAAIFRWLAAEVSPDTYVNIMAQYRPEYQVGSVAPDGKAKYTDIERRPQPNEITRAYDAARNAGLWRFDERWLV
ncbi:MAG: radical SAM protein [Candidatus Hydrogenedentes bacterium]|nr:radical SAM protein [Candidatus Hydrogenedentota bacterium]